MHANFSLAFPAMPSRMLLQGWVSKENPGWVKIDHANNYWMPIAQDGHDVVHFQK